MNASQPKSQYPSKVRPHLPRWSWRCAVALAVIAMPAYTQSVTTVAQPVRITVPVSSTDSNGVSFTTTVANVAVPVVLGIPTLPTGAGYSLDTNNLTTNATGILTLNTTNIAEGEHSFALEASGGATSSLLLKLQAAHIWTGATFTNGGTASFSDAGNWLGGNIPGPTSDVVLNDSGGQSSDTTTPNILISADTEIGSLRSAITSGATRRHNIQINDGTTLKITGERGLSVLRDRSDSVQEWRLAFTGEHGTLLVSNQTASILTFNQANQNGRLLLDGLGSFIADIYRFAVSDYRSYPNYDSMKANGYTGNALPQQGPPGHNYLARTNIIKSSFAGDPSDWNDPALREYSMVIGRNETSGSTQRQPFRLGISNVLFMNSICFAGSASAGMDGNGSVVFHPSFTDSNCIAIFRGPGGMNDRMAMFALSDGAGIGASSGASKSTPNFGGGTLDLLVNRLYLARERTNSSGSPPSSSPSARITMGNGIIDANHLILGFQGQGNNLGVGAAFCQGILSIASNGTIRVNQTLELGHTTAEVGHTTQAEQGFGQVTVSGGGTLMASNITVGGVTKISVNNNITLTSGGRLIITNGLGENVPGGKLNLLNMTDASLTLHVDGNMPRVFVKTLTLNGLNNKINIGSIANVGETYPVRIPLVSYETSAGSFGVGTMPPGFFGIIDVDAVNLTVDLIITPHEGNRLVWTGASSSTWNHSDPNWVTSPGGVATNFNDGDFVRFDDTASANAEINVSETVLLGQPAEGAGMLVTNHTKHYRFFGSGNIAGTAQLRKDGAANLTIDATSQLPMLINTGALFGAGAIGATTLASGATLSFAGSINGGLTAAGTASILPGGSLTGPLALQAAALTNAGTITSSTITLQPGSYLENKETINVTVPWTLTTNSTLVNNGSIIQSGPTAGNQGLNVNGTLRGTGRITQTGFQLASDVRVTLQPGGKLSIGNIPGEITNLTIAVRLDMRAGSVTTFDVDNSVAANDRILLTDGFIQGKVNFGDNSSLGGTIVVNRTAGPAFTLASSLNLFDLTSNNPDNSAQAIPGVIPPPAPALVWDLSEMLTKLALRVTGPVSLTNVITETNLVFTWPEAQRGWRLERQTNSLAVGIALNPTNWVTVASSFGGTNVYYPDTNNLNVFFFRSIQSLNTNIPTVFYRLAYP